VRRVTPRVTRLLRFQLRLLALTAWVLSFYTTRTFGQTPARPAPTYREQTADQQVIHVLNRLGFGPRPGDVDAVRRMGVDTWIDQQLHPDRIDDPKVDQLLAAYPMLTQGQNDFAQEFAEYARVRALRRMAKADTTVMMTVADSQSLKQVNQRRVQLVGQLESSRIARAVIGQRQLQEVMTDFWENHFNVYAKKGAVEPYYLVDYDRTIREHALGNFRDLLGAVAHSPAMLFYLDNAESRANPGQPTLEPNRRDAMVFRRATPRIPPVVANKARTAGLNENYGRELLELHTLGVDGGYTQHDVIDVARALTGWTIRPPVQGGGFIFRPVWHDAAAKVVLGHTLPGNRGEEDGEDVLDIIAKHPSTAHFIALKLARRFVSDSPSAALVNRAAQTFLHTDGDIREVIRTIVTSNEFFSHAAYRAKVKSPFEVVVSAARAMDARPDTTLASAFAVGYLGAPLFGHQAPNGYPETGDEWMNTGAILNRINFGLAVAADRLPGASVETFPGADTLRAAARTEQVDAVIHSMLGGGVSTDTRKILLSGENPLATNPNATVDNTSGADSTSMTVAAPGARLRPRQLLNGRGTFIGIRGLGAPPTLTGFAQVVGLAIGSPEFQRR